MAGANTLETRLVAKVYPNPTTKDAKVFFQNLIITPTGELGKIDEGPVSDFRTVNNGILAVDMPNFYLAYGDVQTHLRLPDPHLRHVGRRNLHSTRRAHASLRRR